MTTEEFELPDVGEGVAEGELVTWLVGPGDPVAEDQPVAEVETDKATVEVPSPYDGTVEELLVEEGETVPVGSVIVTFEVDDGEESADESDDASEDAEGGESGSPDAADAAEARADDAGEGEETATAETDEEPSGRVFAPPSARRLARELGVEVGNVEGSGPGGRVTDADVRAAAEASDGSDDEDEDEDASGPREVRIGEGKRAVRKRSDDADAGEGSSETEETDESGPVAAPSRERTLAAPATRRAAETGASETEAEGEPGDPERGETVPYRGIRRPVGERMAESKYTAPHVTHHDTVVVDDLVETRDALKPRAAERGVKLTCLPFVIEALVAALKEFPILNSELREEDEEIVLKRQYNVGVAVATDAGLMVPVVRDADRKSALELAEEVTDLAARARERDLAREEMQGGTFTVTNFGAVGGEYATPVINRPETAILGLGAIDERPVAADGEVRAAHTLPLSLSIDHRVVDGADAARFTDRLMEYLADPRLLLLE